MPFDSPQEPRIGYGYNEYMTKVEEISESERYVEAAQDAEWRMAMEEEMYALAENETWDLIDFSKGVKSI